MDMGTNFSARRGASPANQRSASLPIRAPLTLEGYSSSDASSYLEEEEEEEESFDSEEETRAFVDVSAGKDSFLVTDGPIESNVEMPRAKLTPEDEDFDDDSFGDESFEEEWGSEVDEEFSVGMEEKGGFLDEERGGQGDDLLGSVENQGEQRAQGNGDVGREVEGVGYFGEGGGEVGRGSSEVEEKKDGVLGEERVEGGHGFLVSMENEGERCLQGNSNGSGEGEGDGCGGYFGEEGGELGRGSSVVEGEVFSVGMEEKGGLLDEMVEEGEQLVQGNGNGDREVEAVACGGYFGETCGELVRGSAEVEEGFSLGMEGKDGFSEEQRVEEENEGEQRQSQGNGEDCGEGEDVGCGWYFGEANGEAAKGSSEVTDSLDGKVDGVRLGDEVPDLAAISAILNKSNGAASADGFSETKDDDTSEEKGKLFERIEQIKAKYLRLLRSLDRSPQDGIAAEVLGLLDLAQGSNGIHPRNRDDFGVEEGGKSDLELKCNILVLGKSGVGKSSTINSIFGERVSATDAFAPATKSIKEIVGIVNGVEICLVDTPGLTNSVALNTKILSSIRKHIRRCPPDVVLYLDRLDVVTSEIDDLPLLRSISSALGSSIWSRVIPVLTHGSYSPCDGSNGEWCHGYRMFVDKRCRFVQNSLQQLVPVTNPVALADSHLGRDDEAGEIVLPDGLKWRLHLLLMCYSLRVLSEVISVLKSEEPPSRSLFGFHISFPPLPHFLSDLLESKNAKMATGQSGESSYSKWISTELSTSKEKHRRTSYFSEHCHQIRLLRRRQLDMKETKGGNLGTGYCDREGVVQATSQLLAGSCLGTKTTGMPLTLLGEETVSGVKVEGEISAGRADVSGGIGTVYSQSKFAYGATLGARLRGKDIPMYPDVCSLGLSLLDWRGELAIGANLESQYLVGRNSRLVLHLGLNNKSKGQFSIRASTSDKLQLALFGILPAVASFFKNLQPTH